MYPWVKFKRLSGCPHDGLIALVDMHRCEKIWEEIVGWVQGGRIPSTYLPWYFEIKSWQIGTYNRESFTLFVFQVIDSLLSDQRERERDRDRQRKKNILSYCNAIFMKKQLLCYFCFPNNEFYKSKYFDAQKLRQSMDGKGPDSVVVSKCKVRPMKSCQLNCSTKICSIFTSIFIFIFHL